MNRKYAVWYKSDRITDEIIEWFVSDITDDEAKAEKARVRRGGSNDIKYQIRPKIASFPVSQLHGSAEQERRAQMFRDYLNRINQVTEQAVANETLIDALTVGATP